MRARAEVSGTFLTITLCLASAWPARGRCEDRPTRNMALGAAYKTNRHTRTDTTGPRAFAWPAGAFVHGHVGEFIYYRGELTDGKSAQSPYDDATVRWDRESYNGTGTQPLPLRIAIDLGTESRVNGVVVHTWPLPPVVGAPSRIEIDCGTASDTELARIGAVEVADVHGAKARRQSHRVAFALVDARFVQVTLHSADPDLRIGLMLDEIEVFGEARQVGAAPGPSPRMIDPGGLWFPDRVPACLLKRERRLNLRVEWGWGPYHETWDGSLAVRKGKIEDVQTLKFDRADGVEASRLDALLSNDAGECEWRSETGGDTDGLLLTLRGSDETNVVFKAAGQTIELPLARLLGRPGRTEELWLGGDDHRVRFFVPHVFPDAVSPIERVKPIFRRTVLLSRGRPEFAVVVPTGDEYADLGRRVRDIVLAASRTEVPILTDSQAMEGALRIRPELLRSSHLVVLGNLCSNRATIPLYGRGYYFADEVFPGKGGYEVRTICDPFGHGRNVVTLSGIGLSEVGLAVAAFEKVLRREGESVYLDFTIDLRLKPLDHPTVVAEHFVRGTDNKRSPLKWTRETARAALAEVRDLLAKREARSLRSAARAAFGLAQAHYWSGDEQMARCAYEAIMAVTPALAAYPDKAELFPGMAGIAGFVTNWDHIEECGHFSDEERLQVTNALLTTCREVLEKAHRGFHSLSRLWGEKVRYDNNHGTCWARGAAEAGQYFRTYYDRPEADVWLWGVAAVNKPTALSHSNIEDAGGYGCYMPIDKWGESLRLGRSGYMDRGVSLSHARWAMTSVNNLGLISGYGDTVGFSAISAFHIVGMAAWYHNHAGCRWFYDHQLRPVKDPSRTKDVGWFNTIASVKQGMRVPKRVAGPSQPPDHLLGLTVLPQWRDSALSWCARSNRHGWSTTEPMYDSKTPDPPLFFDKLCFRDAWDPDAQYLLLDGRYNGTHAQSDANSIVCLTDKGRQWLFDNDSCTRNSVPNHNSVSFSVGGKGRDAQREVLLLGAADLDDLGLARTRLPNAAAGDWDRCLFWHKGRHFLVIDRIRFRSDTEPYLVRCNWKTMGRCSLTGRSLRVEQDGQEFVIATDGSSLLRTRRLDHSQYGSWRSYPFIEKPSDAVATYLEQWRIGRFGVGDRIAFTTLLYGSDPKEPTSYDVRSVETGIAVISGSGVYGAPAEGVYTGSGLNVRAQTFVLRDDAFAMLWGTHLGCGGETLVSSDRPVSIQCCLSKGTGTLIADRPAQVSLAFGAPAVEIDGKAHRAMRLSVPAGESKLRFAAPVRHQALCEVVRSLSAKAQATPETVAFDESVLNLPRVDVLAKARFGAPIAGIAVARAGEDGRADIVVALADGSICCLDETAKPRWQKHVGPGPASVACADLDGDGRDEVIATATTTTVAAFRADGSPLWSATCEGDEHPTQFVKAGDVDRDGESEIVVGKESLYLLDYQGKLRWRHLKIDLRNRKLVVVQAALADCTGDGRLEIACLTQFPAQLWLLDADRKHVFTKGRCGPDADTCGQSVQIDAFDGNGDGEAEIYNAVVFGVCRHLPTGRADKAWKRNAATAITHVPAERGRSLVMATETGDLIRIRDWHNAWHVQLDAPASLLVCVDVTAGDPPQIAAALQTGALVLVSAEGKPLARFADGHSRPTALLAAGFGKAGRPRFMMGREDGLLVVLGKAGGGDPP